MLLTKDLSNEQTEPPPPPPPRQITLKTLKDNGAEEFHGDRISNPQIALDWIEQTERVLKNLSVPEARRPELAFQLLRKGAYEWWKRADEKAPKPWTWEHFDWAFKKEYIPARFREEKRTEFMELKQGDMTLPELRQKFDHLAQFATTLVATPADRIEEFRKRLRPDIRPYVSILTTTDFSKAYDLMAKAEKDVDDYKASLKVEEGGPSTRPTVSVTPSAKRPLGEASEASHAKKSKSMQVQPAPAQSVASSGRSKPSRHPTCELCGRNHPGECWFAQGLCLGCGKPGHIRRNCPTKPGEPFPTAPVRGQTATPQLTQSQRTTAGTNQQRNPNQPQGRAPARTYAMIGHADPQDNDVHNELVTRRTDEAGRRHCSSLTAAAVLTGKTARPLRGVRRRCSVVKSPFADVSFV
ncbi:unnamed protein product [Cuscuta campestris]|uniref:CCHC-type domain-containing protein n=1 Tax=Cuscuta campestris TaxID=132261 RepID=A0A484LS62_9ASTE|nr:unnamed protein product [Cuscuta campestris]